MPRKATLCWRGGAIGLIAWATSGMVHASPVPSLPSTPARNPEVIVSVQKNRPLDAAFQHYGNTSGIAWAGGDSTYSLRLPNRRELWIFSDTLLGPVNSVGELAWPNPILIHNSFVVQRGNHWSTKMGGTASTGPQSLVGPSAGSSWWYWAGAPTTVANHLEVFYEKFKTVGNGVFNFQFAGSAIAVFRASSLALQRLVPMYTKSQVMWGAGLMNAGGFTYIYGVQDSGTQKDLHIARVPVGHLLQRPWTFYTGQGWSTSPDRSIAVLSGVSNELSVVQRGGIYVLVTTDDAVAGLSPDIIVAFAKTPTGPFVTPTLAYKTPGTSHQIFTYNALAHPELSTGNRLVISYNENALSMAQVEGDIGIYRPRFITLQLHLAAIRRRLSIIPPPSERAPG